MENTKNNKTFQDVLSHSSTIIPLLSEEEIRLILIETILAYIKKEIRLETVMRVVEQIKHFKNITLSKKIENEISEILALNYVDDILLDVLDALTER